MKKTILSVVTSLVLANSAIAVENKVYAVVNGDNITAQSIAIALKDPKVQFDSLPKDTQKNILNRMIEQKLLSQKAMTTDAIKNKIYLDTLRSVKQDLALQVWMKQLASEIKVSDSELKDYYAKNKSTLQQPLQYKARHILVPTAQEANEIIKTLQSAKDLKSKFIALAKTKSTGPSGKNGGDLGWFGPTQMVAEFSQATAALKLGSITTQPVKTQFGFHVIYLEDKKKETTVNFEQAKTTMQKQIGQDKFIKQIQNLADDLKKKAKIEYK